VRFTQKCSIKIVILCSCRSWTLGIMWLLMSRPSGLYHNLSMSTCLLLLVILSDLQVNMHTTSLNKASNQSSQQSLSMIFLKLRATTLKSCHPRKAWAASRIQTQLSFCPEKSRKSRESTWMPSWCTKVLPYPYQTSNLTTILKAKYSRQSWPRRRKTKTYSLHQTISRCVSWNKTMTICGRNHTSKPRMAIKAFSWQKLTTMAR